jgi:hypothetical protein
VFSAVAGGGRDTSASDVRALAQTIASVRFPPLRSGDLAGSFYVLKRPGAYPLGTVTRVHPRPATLSPFYLVHDRSGFRAIGWQSVPCGIRFDSSQSQFFCPGGGRWDSAGNVIVNPPGARDIEPLVRYGTAISQGHLLLTESVGYVSGCAANLARHVPACPNYQPDSSNSRTS